MFEKEAEEHCNEVLCSVCENPTCTEHLKCREWRDRRVGFYCGAELGYSTCFEQVQRLVNEGTRLDCIISELLRLQEKE